MHGGWSLLMVSRWLFEAARLFTDLLVPAGVSRCLPKAARL